MVLPLGFCRLKDHCYIKTARTCNIGKKGFEDDSSALRSVCLLNFFFFFFSSLSFFFFFSFFIHVPPPHYWCRLAVSGSNNIAEWFSKNTGAAARLFRGVTLGGGRRQSAAPFNRRGFACAQTGPLTDTSCGAGVSSLLGRRGKLSHETERMSVCIDLYCIERVHWLQEKSL